MSTRKIASLLAVALLGAGFLSPEYRAFALLPAQVEIPSDGVLDLNSGVSWLGPQGNGIGVTSLPHGLRIKARKDGVLRLRLAGVRVKDVKVQSVAPQRVLLGGQALGVRLRARGSIVVLLERIPTLDGGLQAPGISAGLRIGDRLLSVDRRPVRDDRHLSTLVDKAGRRGQPVRLEVLRQGRVLALTARPAFDRQLGRYRLGVYVRDGMTGIGTLTFTDGKLGFAALGHQVELVPRGEVPQSGVILPATIFGVQRAKRGTPGQKLGAIEYGEGMLGVVRENRQVGIGGKLAHPVQGRRVEIATPSQVHPGEAIIFTVLSGHTVRPYRVRIERTTTARAAGAKSIVLHVVDERLLRQTGGIVQGMSGSPIVQDGLLVGAVTHVFVHDPTRGYGTFAQWMYEDLCARNVRHGSARDGSGLSPRQVAERHSRSVRSASSGTYPQKPIAAVL